VGVTGLSVADVLPFLKPHHFYEVRHRHVYAAMAALFERAAAIDYHTIAEELEHQGTSTRERTNRAEGWSICRN